MGWTRRLALTGAGVALVGAVVWGLWPQPEAVDLAAVTRGPLQVTVSAEGVTRVREPYTVTAPIAGTLARMPVEVGDGVERGVTVVAVISPAEPALMDARSRAQAEAAVREAEASLTLAETDMRRAISNLSHAQSELDRSRALAAAGTISQRALENAEQAFTTASQALASARSERDLRQASLVRAQAQLLEPGAAGGAGEALRLTAPHSGRVLSVTDPSSRVVAAGSALLSIGDLSDLDLEIDLLSSDAVRVAPGARAYVERWGGPGVLEAVVRRIEPAAFTDVSALGIEEQRVRLRLDFVTPVDERPGLGDRYRVFVRVVIWEGEDLTLVPQAALFRSGGGWAVFRLRGERVETVPVELGQQTDGQAQVLGGLSEGDRVVLYPSSTLVDGARVVARAG